MEKRKIKNKSWFIIIGSFLFLIGLSLIGYDYFSNKNIKDIENNELFKEGLFTIQDISSMMASKDYMNI